LFSAVNRDVALRPMFTHVCICNVRQAELKSEAWLLLVLGSRDYETRNRE